jgi:tetratricopeptide (TPR) repeat protein
LIERGSFKDIVTNLRLQKSLKFLMLTLQSANRPYAEGIASWISRLGDPELSDIHAQRVDERDYDESDWADDADASGRKRGAYEQVRAQQNAIVERLKERNIDSARALARSLIDQQRSNSTPEQIGKSLCWLAQRAKYQEVHELQLEWSEWATQENPFDPRTHGQFADALLDAGRFADATKEFDEVARTGDARFAEVGFARVQRAMGYPLEARQKLLEIANQYPGDAQVVHAYYAAADALRDLGDYATAKEEFARLTDRFPLESMFWEGLATAQFELGEVNESLRTFSKARANAKRDRSVSMNGLARAYRLLGRFVDAQRIYEEVITWFPNNKVALCGKAELLKVAGSTESALTAFDVAIERCPYSAEPIIGKGQLLLELHRYEEAQQLYGEASARFERNVDIAASLVEAFKAQGRYQEALSKVETLILEFPFYVRGRILRASVLHRLGELNNALAAYDEVLSERPFLQSALSGKVAVLISMERFSEADQLLPKHKPRTQTDWSRCILRAICAAHLLGYQRATRMLRTWESICPFVRQRRSIRSALVRAEVGAGRFADARKLVEDAPTEVSNVVAMEALAAGHRSGAAKERLRQIEVAERPGIVIDLAREIARRHGLIAEAPLQSEHWITRMQREILVQQAA